jgi:hypothetical protein
MLDVAALYARHRESLLGFLVTNAQTKVTVHQLHSSR